MKMPRIPKPMEVLLQEAQDAGRLAHIFRVIATLPKAEQYLHWDEVYYRQPPSGLTREEWWFALKFQRSSSIRRVPLRCKSGNLFGFCIPDSVSQELHEIDRGAGIFIGVQSPINNPQIRDRYIVRSLFEEAITSSQLEGAVTTREVAKAMLSSGRKPRNRSEKMILNNYRTMEHICALKDEALTPEIVLDIHRIISQDALDNPECSGKLRETDEIEVSDDEGNIFFVPPPASELSERLEEMCHFANAETPDFFVHPIIRGVILHFWLAYDHPFLDGNGRTARALFYWMMLRNKYWLFEFISISQIIIKAPVKYYRSFLFTETDANDLTYFIIHQTEVIRRALQTLHDYIDRTSKEVEETTALLNQSTSFNLRQEALLAHALKHPKFRYTVKEYQGKNRVAYETARSDLMSLAEAGLLIKQKMGDRKYIYFAPSDLAERLKNFNEFIP